jgi:hypothetical protein
MFSLQDLLGQAQGDQALGQISSQIGAEPSMTSSAIQMALPMLINAMGNQAQGGNSGQLTDMITQDNGGVLDNLGGLGSLLGGGSSSPAGNILGMLLGSQQGQATQQISNNSGLGMGQVASLLMMLAPMIMGYFGKQQTQQNLNQGGILDMLMGSQQQVQQAQPQVQQGLIEGLLDADRDGSAMDDIASMALKYMTSR